MKKLFLAAPLIAITSTAALAGDHNCQVVLDRNFGTVTNCAPDISETGGVNSYVEGGGTSNNPTYVNTINGAYNTYSGTSYIGSGGYDAHVFSWLDWYYAVDYYYYSE